MGWLVCHVEEYSQRRSYFGDEDCPTAPTITRERAKRYATKIAAQKALETRADRIGCPVDDYEIEHVADWVVKWVEIGSYFTGDTHGPFSWETQRSKAKRYASKEAAEAAIRPRIDAKKIPAHLLRLVKLVAKKKS